jgi:hypothetical protein
MRKRCIGFDIKNAGKGEVEALFSRFDVIDHDGDVTLKGAFTEGQPVVISAYNHASHRTAALPVGKGTIHESAAENGEVMKGRFLLNTTHGADTFETVKALSEDGLQEWSYSLHDVVATKGTWEGERARIIEQVGFVKEVSPVLMGAGIDTVTLDVKAAKQLHSSTAGLLSQEARRRWGWAWLEDFDPDAGYAVFQVETDDGWRLVQVDYEATDTTATLAEQETEVHRTALYLPKSAKFHEHTSTALRSVKGLVEMATDRLTVRAAEGKSIDEQLAVLDLLEAELAPLRDAIAKTRTPHTPAADTAAGLHLEYARALSLLTTH